MDVEEKISLLNQRLYSTFVSLEIRTLQLLIRYLEKIHESGSNNIVIGIRKFHYVWEFLLRNIFHNVDLKINSGVRLAYLAKNFAIGQADMKEMIGRPAAKCPENLKAIPLISTAGSACVSCSLCVYSKSDIIFSSSKK